MEKDKIFFSENGNGLTATSANHIANLSKELIAQIEQELSSICFYNSSITVIGSDKNTVIQKGVGKDFLYSVGEKLEMISKAHALIAWLREAIKAKESLTKEVPNNIYGYANNVGISIPDKPVEPDNLPIDYFVSLLSIKERNRILELNAQTSALGKFIHPERAYNVARKDLHDKIVHPNKVTGNGRDTIIYSYEQTVSAEDVDEVFFSIQQAHRALQAELNGINSALEQKQKEDYEAALAEYTIELDEYNIRIREITNEFTKWRLAELKRIEELKIIIPNDLKSTYDEVSKLGK